MTFSHIIFIELKNCVDYSATSAIKVQVLSSRDRHYLLSCFL